MLGIHCHQAQSPSCSNRQYFFRAAKANIRYLRAPVSQASCKGIAQFRAGKARIPPQHHPLRPAYLCHGPAQSAGQRGVHILGYAPANVVCLETGESGLHAIPFVLHWCPQSPPFRRSTFHSIVTTGHGAHCVVRPVMNSGKASPTRFSLSGTGGPDGADNLCAFPDRRPADARSCAPAGRPQTSG